MALFKKSKTVKPVTAPKPVPKAAPAAPPKPVPKTTPAPVAAAPAAPTVPAVGFVAQALDIRIYGEPPQGVITAIDAAGRTLVIRLSPAIAARLRVWRWEP